MTDKEVIKQAIREVIAEAEEMQKNNPPSLFGILCKYCLKPILSGQIFAIFHIDSFEENKK